MWDILFDFLLPRRSITGVAGVWITDEERKALRSFPVRLEQNVLRERGIHFVDRLVAGSTYDHSPYLRSVLHLFKYGRVRVLAQDLGLLLVNALPILPIPEGSVLCPVPLHVLRRVSRGFNQADLLARVVAKASGLPYDQMLRRSRATGHQAWRSKEERKTALAKAFRCAVPVVPRSVILIDDIATTGATLDACAEVLKAAGAERVAALVVACA